MWGCFAGMVAGQAVISNHCSVTYNHILDSSHQPLRSAYYMVCHLDKAKRRGIPVPLTCAGDGKVVGTDQMAEPRGTY